MDELYKQIQHFIEIMTMFNNGIAENWDSLQSAFRDADEVWGEQGDQTRREFENNWSQLGTALRQYRTNDSEQYMMFLLRRKQALDEYFGS